MRDKTIIDNQYDLRSGSSHSSRDVTFACQEPLGTRSLNEFSSCQILCDTVRDTGDLFQTDFHGNQKKILMYYMHGMCEIKKNNMLTGLWVCLLCIFQAPVCIFYQPQQFHAFSDCFVFILTVIILQTLVYVPGRF